MHVPSHLQSLLLSEQIREFLHASGVIDVSCDCVSMQQVVSKGVSMPVVLRVWVCMPMVSEGVSMQEASESVSMHIAWCVLLRLSVTWRAGDDGHSSEHAWRRLLRHASCCCCCACACAHHTFLLFCHPGCPCLFLSLSISHPSCRSSLHLTCPPPLPSKHKPPPPIVWALCVWLAPCLPACLRPELFALCCVPFACWSTWPPVPVCGDWFYISLWRPHKGTPLSSARTASADDAPILSRALHVSQLT